MTMSEKYCTDCGALLRDKNSAPYTQLYDEDLFAKTGILKLVPCSVCGLQIADKYVECDGALLLIDLALQSKQAYRHVLLNGRYSSLLLKMAVLTIICDGYIGWSTTAGTGEFFEQEYEFYVTCSKVILAVVGFLCTVMVASRFNSPKTLLFGLLLSYSSRFFNLMALLWSPSNVMWAFVYLLFFVSSVRVHQVTQETKCGLSSWIVMLVGHIVFVCILNLDQWLQPFVCLPLK